jgi:transcriptional regulator of acetoin/glycerol metabolism
LEIQNSGNDVIKIKMFENVSRYDSFKIENSLINKIGREDQENGPLLNTIGGKDFKNYEMNYSPINIENQINGLILDTLNSTGKINKAAKRLGISPRTLYRRMKSLGIVKKDKKFVIN